jgi:hypothetical protein
VTFLFSQESQVSLYRERVARGDCQMCGRRLERRRRLGRLRTKEITDTPAGQISRLCRGGWERRRTSNCSFGVLFLCPASVAQAIKIAGLFVLRVCESVHCSLNRIMKIETIAHFSQMASSIPNALLFREAGCQEVHHGFSRIPALIQVSSSSLDADRGANHLG